MDITTSPTSPQDPTPRNRWSWRKRLTVTILAIVAFFVVAGALGAAFGSHQAPAPKVTHTPVAAAPATTHPIAPVTTTPAASTPATTAPAATQPAAPAATVAPAAPPADQILARFSGTGMGTTVPFTVPADGSWHLSWAYTNGTTFAGQAENFQVYEYDASGNLIGVLVNALAIGDGTPTATPVYDAANAGSPVHFQVITEDAHWELVPVSGTS